MQSTEYTVHGHAQTFGVHLCSVKYPLRCASNPRRRSSAHSESLTRKLALSLAAPLQAPLQISRPGHHQRRRLVPAAPATQAENSCRGLTVAFFATAQGRLAPYRAGRIRVRSRDRVSYPPSRATLHTDAPPPLRRAWTSAWSTRTVSASTARAATTTATRRRPACATMPPCSWLRARCASTRPSRPTRSAATRRETHQIGRD